MGLLNLENFIDFSPFGYQVIAHTLTLGYAAHAAAILYFIVTINRSSGRYRSSSVLSIVVMVSAALLLFRLSVSFDAAFVFDGERYVVTDQPFTHGWRYLNWLIDVPCLLIQLLYAFELTAKRVLNLRVLLGATGALMVVLGYIGQFYEVENLTLMLVWGAASTVPYAVFFVVIWRLMGASKTTLPGPAWVTMRNIRLLFLFSWGLYPLAYLMPLFGVTEGVAVARTLMFTAADVLSKIIYGLMLAKVLQIKSAAEGHGPALEEYPAAAQPLAAPDAAAPDRIG